MKNQKETAIIIRWIARIWGTSFFVFVLFLLFGLIFGNEGGFRIRDVKDAIVAITGIIAIIGLGIALKWEGLGGLLILVGLTGFCIVRYDSSFISSVIGFAPPGILYIVYWYLSKGQFKTLESVEVYSPPLEAKEETNTSNYPVHLRQGDLLMKTPTSILWIKGLLVFRLIFSIAILIMIAIVIFSKPEEGFFTAFVNSIIRSYEDSQQYRDPAVLFSSLMGRLFVPILIVYIEYLLVQRKKRIAFWIVLVLDINSFIAYHSFPLFPLLILILRLRKSSRLYFQSNENRIETNSNLQN